MQIVGRELNCHKLAAVCFIGVFVIAGCLQGEISLYMYTVIQNNNSLKPIGNAEYP